MPASDHSEPLASAPLSDSLRRLARRGVVKPLRKGVQIITEGDFGESLYIVLSGRLRAFSVGNDGREITFAEYGPGEYVGEMSLDSGPRSASVETLQATMCVIVTRLTLEQHLADEPAFAFELLAKVIRRARAATLGMRQIALNDVYGRLKPLLEGLTEPAVEGARQIAPAPSHLEISRHLGCSRDMVTRLMGHLEAGGYVRAGRRRIELLRPLPAKW